MNYLKMKPSKRAVTYIKRRPGKSMILMLLVFMLGTLISGAVSIEHAIYRTEANLWAQIPPLASIEIDFDASRDEIAEVNRVGLSPEMIRQVGALPYVANFDYRFRHVFWQNTLELYDNFGRNNDLSSRFESGARASIVLTGVYNPNVSDIQEGMISLVSGRVFTQEEMDSTGHLALVSQEFARLNQLDIGYTFTLESRAYDWNSIWGNWNDDWDVMSEGHFHGSEEFELEIIGIFEVLREERDTEIYGDYADMMAEIETERTFGLQNAIYVPVSLTEAFHALEFEMVAESTGSSDFEDAEEARNLGMMGTTGLIPSLFALYNPFDMPFFLEAADTILLDALRIEDLSGSFAHMAYSMETMHWIADLIFWGATVTTFVVLSLLIILFLRDRKHEIGIYLAIGERKAKIVKQVLIEVLSLTVVSLTLAIIAGNILASRLSQSMLEQDLTRQAESASASHGVGNALGLFNPGQMSIYEMMENYDTSTSLSTILFIFGVTLFTVFLASLISILYVTRLNPKKILMSSQG